MRSLKYVRPLLVKISPNILMTCTVYDNKTADVVLTSAFHLMDIAIVKL